MAYVATALCALAFVAILTGQCVYFQIRLKSEQVVFVHSTNAFILCVVFAFVGLPAAYHRWSKHPRIEHESILITCCMVTSGCYFLARRCYVMEKPVHEAEALILCIGSGYLIYENVTCEDTFAHRVAAMLSFLFGLRYAYLCIHWALQKKVHSDITIQFIRHMEIIGMVSLAYLDVWTQPSATESPEWYVVLYILLFPFYFPQIEVISHPPMTMVFPQFNLLTNSTQSAPLMDGQANTPPVEGEDASVDEGDDKMRTVSL